jgi:hypothetical protein
MDVGKEKTPLCSTPEIKKDVDLEKFAAGAGMYIAKRKKCYSLEELHIRKDVLKIIPSGVQSHSYSIQYELLYPGADKG